MKLVLILLVDIQNALISLQEWQRAVMLQIEVKGSDYLLLEGDQLLASDLLAQQSR